MQELLQQVNVWALKQAYHQTLREVLSHIDIVKRLDRAMAILTTDSGYEITVDSAGVFTVQSPNDTYTITGQTCSCPDAQTLCKHRLCIRLILCAVERQAT